MRSAILIVFLLLLFGAPCVAQKACQLEAENAPTLFGVQLQMSPEQVRSVFGKDLKIKIKKRGERTFFQNFSKEPAPPSLSGVRALYLRFFDRQLYQIEVFYENRSEWQTIDDFTNYLSTALKLPARSWEEVQGKRNYNCDGITLSADKVLNPRIEITDEQTRSKVEELRVQQSKKE